MAPATSRKLFVNLPVDDLQRSVDFFTKLGFTFDPTFTDESATCMIVGEDAFVMLLVAPRFSDFTTKPICDTSTSIEAIMSVSAGSRDEVDTLAETALASGATPANDPLEMDFMYGRSFHDPDGHLWEVVWVDMAKVEQQAPAAAGSSG